MPHLCDAHQIVGMNTKNWSKLDTFLPSVLWSTFPPLFLLPHLYPSIEHGQKRKQILGLKKWIGGHIKDFSSYCFSYVNHPPITLYREVAAVVFILKVVAENVIPSYIPPTETSGA